MLSPESVRGCPPKTPLPTPIAPAWLRMILEAKKKAFQRASLKSWPAGGNSPNAFGSALRGYPPSIGHSVQASCGESRADIVTFGCVLHRPDGHILGTLKGIRLLGTHEASPAPTPLRLAIACAWLGS